LSLKVDINCSKLQLERLKPFSSTSRLEALYLHGRHYPTSPIPDFFFNGRSKQLQHVRIHNWWFNDTLREEVFSNASVVVSLVVSNALLYGFIPPSVFDMPCLRIIDLSLNQLSGTLPNVTKKRMKKMRCMQLQGYKKKLHNANIHLEPFQTDAYFYINGFFSFPRHMLNFTKWCTDKQVNVKKEHIARFEDYRQPYLAKEMWKCGEMYCVIDNEGNPMYHNNTIKCLAANYKKDLHSHERRMQFCDYSNIGARLTSIDKCVADLNDD
tara:strand:- start:574 stop:1377 length:804 start_codon:yes stop_codon:yes gene_type:complete